MERESRCKVTVSPTTRIMATTLTKCLRLDRRGRLMKILFILLTTMLGVSALADIIPVPGSQRLRPVFDSSDLVCYCTIESVDVSVDPAAANGTNGWVRQRARAVVDISAAYKQDRAAG